MSGFLRPEVRALLWRWRELLIGVLLALFGLWLVLGPGFLLSVPGYALLFGGAILAFLGVQRGRFRGADGGAGSVQVDEGQVTYFGPLTGGSVALRELERLTLDRALVPAHWRLEQRGHPALLIPVNAEGSDALFDAFAALPGLRTERMLQELQGAPHQAVVIWQKGAAVPAGITVH